MASTASLYEAYSGEMEDRLLVVLSVLGLVVAVLTLWPRLDHGLDWLAVHLPAAPKVLCGAGLMVAVPAFLFGAIHVALPGAALAVSGAVVHRVCQEAALGAPRVASSSARVGTGRP